MLLPIADSIRRAVGRQAPGRKNRHREDADDDDALEVAMDVGLGGHRAEEVGAERCAGGSHPHQRESDHIAWPVRPRLVHEQTPN